MKKLCVLFCIFTLLFSTVFCTANASVYEENPPKDAPSDHIIYVPYDQRQDYYFHGANGMVFYKAPRIYDYFRSYLKSGKTKEKPNLMVGDVNIDGKINAADAIFAMYYIGYFRVGTYDGQYYYVPNNPYYEVEMPELTMDAVTNFRQPYATNCCRYLNDFKGNNMYQNENHLSAIGYNYYRMNSALMADTNYDGKVNAADALLILKYAVGKIDSFPRKDFSTTRDTWPMYYVPWPDEEFDLDSFIFIRKNLFPEEYK